MDSVNEDSANSVMAKGPANGLPNDGTGEPLVRAFASSTNLLAGVVKLDPWLSPFKDSLRKRYSKAQDWITAINKSEGGLDKFSRGTEKFGFNVDKQNNITYREWAPNATQAFLIGDFSIPPLSWILSSICWKLTICR